MKSIAKNAFFNVIYQLMNILFPLVTSVYVSRVILPSGVGQVSYAQNIASYFLTLAPLGVTSYGIRMIAQTARRQEQLNKTFSELFMINIISTCLFSLGYYALILSNNSFQESRVLFCICGLQIILNLFNVDWFYQGLEEYKYITVRSFIVKVFALLAVFIFVRDESDYLIYALITVVAVGGNYLFNMFHLRQYVHLSFYNLEFKKHIITELILATNILLSDLYSKTDVTMLGLMTDSTTTGYYTNAFKIVNIVLQMSAAMTVVFLPRLSLYYRQDKQQFNALVNKGIQIVLFTTLPLMVGLDLVSIEAIPLLFGKAFSPTAYTVIVLSPLIFIKGLGNLLCYQILISTGNERKQTIPYAVTAVLNIGLNALLIPAYQQNGAAIASVIAEFTLNFAILVYTRKLIDFNIDKHNLLKTFFSVFCMGLVVFIIRYLQLSDSWTVVLAVICGGVFYLSSSLVLKNSIAIEAVNIMKCRKNVT